MTVKELTDALYEMGEGKDEVVFHVSGDVEMELQVDENTPRYCGAYTAVSSLDVIGEAEGIDSAPGTVVVKIEF